MKNKKITSKNIIIILFIIILVLILSSFTYLLTGNYKAEEDVLNYLNSTEIVNVSKVKEGYFFDGPGESTAIIFYPGAKVDYRAYSRLMYKIAENGKDCFLIKMPFNIAILGADKADKIIDKYNYENYYISGHSLGGVVACNYAKKNSEKIKAVICLAAYSSVRIPSRIKYISIYGSEDKVLNKEKYDEAKKFLNDEAKEFVIEGGNHSGFANYGEQKKDGKSQITKEEQQNYVVKVLSDL